MPSISLSSGSLRRWRHLSLMGALALTATMAMPALAGWQHWSLDEHSTDNTLTWHNSEGRSLALDSTAGKGIVIVKLEPAGSHGLQPGDVILTVNGHAVKHVTDLIAQANADEHDTVTLEVQRGGESKDVAMAGTKLHALVHPHP